MSRLKIKRYIIQHMISSRDKGGMFSGIDWGVILIYLLLVFAGWLNILSVNYSESSFVSVFDLSHRYGVQLLWIAISLVAAITILLIDKIYFHYFAFPVYYLLLLSLIAVMIFGKEINGAKSWFEIGSFRLQPAEFGKFATSLALARYMSSYSFNISRVRSLLGVMMIIMMPFAAIILQNDTGSALVYVAFFIMLYREGFNQWFYIFGIIIVTLFVFSFLFTFESVFLFILITTLVVESITNGDYISKLRYFALIMAIYISLSAVAYFTGVEGEYEHLIALGSVFVTVPLVIIYAYRRQLKNIFMFVGLFICSMSFVSSVEYVLNNIMQQHQRDRIFILLGLVTDNKGTGYNVNQSKIAIGSGGFSGKGFLQGTQTKFNFVPEQSTDFIYCTVGEEWGFLGSGLVMIMFAVLILRLMRMGERQKDAFVRIYCYCVASIFLAHVVINIGMTIGILPVIGIPLPFFSYGGSSLLAFTILLFVAVSLDKTDRGRSSQF